MILICSYDNDYHAIDVETILKKRGAQYARYCQSGFPTKVKMGMVFKDEALLSSLNIGDQKFRTSDFSTVWHRRYITPTPHEQVKNKRLRAYIQKESSAFLTSLECFTPNALWVPGSTSTIQLAENKNRQLLLASQLGFTIPETVTGNDAEMVEEYLLSNHSLFTVKPFYMGVFKDELTPFQKIKKFFYELKHKEFFNQYKNDPEFLEFYKYDSRLWMTTLQLDIAAAKNTLPSLQTCPVIFQKYIPKQFELRITVVGNKIFPCAIYSQESEQSKHDFRAGGGDDCRHEKYNLPSDIEQKCFAFIKKLGLQFGCIDMIVTPDGEHVFLENNPGGQWLWIQERTGMPIAEAIADLLVHPEECSL